MTDELNDPGASPAPEALHIAAPQPAQEPAPAAPHPVDAAVDRWFSEFMHSSPVSRAGSEIYNHVYNAVAILKERLKEI